jgi:hypothetical protein
MMQLDSGQLVFQRLTDLRPEEACLKGVIEILGVPHHVYLIEVQEVDVAGGAACQEAVNDPHDRLGDVQRFNDNRLLTVQVRGFEGNYVMVIFPFAE